MSSSRRVIRDRLDQAIAAADAANLQAQLQISWRGDPGLATAGAILSRLESIRSMLALAPFRIAFLGSCTIDPAVILFQAAAVIEGIEVQPYVGSFNAYAQEILVADSGLYRSKPQGTILAVQTRDIAPELWDGFADLSTDQITAVVERVSAELAGLVRTLRSRSQCHIIVHTLDTPADLGNGLLDAQQTASQAGAIQTVNKSLLRLAREEPGVYLLDYDALVARHGRQAWYDERNWVSARLPFAAASLVHLARQWLGFMPSLTGKLCKVVAVDLDNTLWGGVVGEDGIDGIALGNGEPGRWFVQLQRVLLDFYRRGILLAVCSKNNRAEAMEVLEQHPGMLLRPEQFAHFCINWIDKAQNLREIATQLNIGLDAMAFLDDNPVEREFVRSQLPEVTVINLPTEPSEYARFVREMPVFQRLALSAEDRERGSYYAGQAMRERLKETATSIEDFYWSLEMRAQIGSVNANNLARVSQLTQKTNQLNVTTRRYSEQEILAMSHDPCWHIYTLGVTDRFGDNGLVAVAIVHDGDQCEIDTFLMSCRVIGRTVETAFLGVIAEQARARGYSKLLGRFIATKKNPPAKDIFSNNGFFRTSEDGGTSLWELDLSTGQPAVPPWIQVEGALQEAIHD
jgi:FkbH-like protein